MPTSMSRRWVILHQYQGFGGYEKTGTSTWTLTGTSTDAAPWIVRAGTLNVDGSIASSSLTMMVNSGATLSGTGVVGNTMITGGTFAPGSGTAGSSMTVTGTLDFNSASTSR